ncbi:hypothetical protein HN51_013663 [Arachis hypogaea]|uniref:Uncharacterized protein n=1 Tax=Arachis hypogaea TaxID=3818 RepID=A0A445DP96_ARAHY|nr:putative uncharacterized protein DDB_G0277255 [Arachis ipaensis]XP_025638934.1 putative uncharacterized protein DDB_G0277255 [Arachis hypogaea]QHO59442.1 uncharacterized protein DS421_3g99130 [Arachis hypogaea]RYR64997.1 hypothetical protein Ahy_A03g011000 [Arachis hypogaea]
MANDNNKRSSSSSSICEISMLLVANIIRLSSLRFSSSSNLSSSSSSQHHEIGGDSTRNSVGKIMSNKNRKHLLLQQPELNPKMPRSYLMKPEKEEEGPTTTTFVNDDVNVDADKFIKKIRAKIINGNNGNPNATAAPPKPKPYSSSPSIYSLKD